MSSTTDSIKKVTLGSGSDTTVLVDLTNTTARVADVAEGKVFYGADGAKKIGVDLTNEEDAMVLGQLKVTAPGEYDISQYPDIDGWDHVSATLSIKNQSKDVTMNTDQASKTVVPDSGYSGLDRVTISVPNTSKTVTPSSTSQTVVDDNKRYLSSVTVKPVPVETGVTFDENKTYTAPDGKYYKTVTVNVANAGGDGGVDTSDATATADQILAGATAYIATGKVEGTIPTFDGDCEGGALLGRRVVKVDELPETLEDGVIYELKRKHMLDMVAIYGLVFSVIADDGKIGSGKPWQTYMWYELPEWPETISLSSVADPYNLIYQDYDDTTPMETQMCIKEDANIFATLEEGLTDEQAIEFMKNNHAEVDTVLGALWMSPLVTVFDDEGNSFNNVLLSEPNGEEFQEIINPTAYPFLNTSFDTSTEAGKWFSNNTEQYTRKANAYIYHNGVLSPALGVAMPEKTALPFGGEIDITVDERGKVDYLPTENTVGGVIDTSRYSYVIRYFTPVFVTKEEIYGDEPIICATNPITSYMRIVNKPGDYSAPTLGEPYTISVDIRPAYSVAELPVKNVDYTALYICNNEIYTRSMIGKWLLNRESLSVYKDIEISFADEKPLSTYFYNANGELELMPIASIEFHLTYPGRSATFYAEGGSYTCHPEYSDTSESGSYYTDTEGKSHQKSFTEMSSEELEKIGTMQITDNIMDENLIKFIVNNYERTEGVDDWVKYSRSEE